MAVAPVAFDVAPLCELNGPSDEKSILRLRQHYQNGARKRRAYCTTVEQKKTEFLTPLYKYMCVGDNRNNQIAALEGKNNELEAEKRYYQTQFSLKKRELDVLKQRIDQVNV